MKSTTTTTLLLTVLVLSMWTISLPVVHAETSTEDQTFLDVVSDSELESDDDQLEDDQDDALHELSIQEGYSVDEQDQDDDDQFGQSSSRDNSEASSAEEEHELQDEDTLSRRHIHTLRTRNPHLRASSNLLGRSLQYMAALGADNAKTYSMSSLKKQARRTRVSTAQLKKFRSKLLKNKLHKINVLRGRYHSIRSRCRGLQVFQRRMLGRAGALRRQIASISARLTASPAKGKNAAFSKQLSPALRSRLRIRQNRLQRALNRLSRHAKRHQRRLIALKDRKYRLKIRIDKKRAAVARTLSEGKTNATRKTHKNLFNLQSRVSRSLIKLHKLRMLRKNINVNKERKVTHGMRQTLENMHTVATTRLSAARVALDAAQQTYKNAVAKFRKESSASGKPVASLKNNIRASRLDYVQKLQMVEDLSQQLRSLKRSRRFQKRWLFYNRKMNRLGPHRYRLRQRMEKARQVVRRSKLAMRNSVQHCATITPRNISLNQMRGNLHLLQKRSIGLKSQWRRYLQYQSRVRQQNRHYYRFVRQRNIARERMLRWERRRLLAQRLQVAKRRWSLSRRIRLMRGQIKRAGSNKPASKSSESSKSSKIMDAEFELTRKVQTIRERIGNAKAKLRLANRELSAVTRQRALNDSRLRRARLSRRKLRVQEAKRLGKRLGRSLVRDQMTLGALLNKQATLSKRLLDDMVYTRGEMEKGNKAYAPSPRHAVNRLIRLGRMSYGIRRRRYFLRRLRRQIHESRLRVINSQLRLQHQQLMVCGVRRQLLRSRERQLRHTTARFHDHVDRLQARLVLAKQRNQAKKAVQWRQRIANAKKRLARYQARSQRAQNRIKTHAGRTKVLYSNFKKRVEDVQTESQNHLLVAKRKLTKLAARRKSDTKKLVKLCALGGMVGADCRSSPLAKRIQVVQIKAAETEKHVGKVLARHAYAQTMLNNYKLSLFNRLYRQEKRVGDRAAKQLERYRANVLRLTKRVEQMRQRGPSAKRRSSKAHRSRQQIMLVANTRKLVESQRRMVANSNRLAGITRSMALLKRIQPQMKSLKKNLSKQEHRESSVTDPRRLMDMRLNQLHARLARKMQNRRSRWNAYRRRMLRVRDQRKRATVRVREQRAVIKSMNNAIRNKSSVLDAASGISSIQQNKLELRELTQERNTLSRHENLLARQSQRYMDRYWRSRRRFLQSNEMQMRWIRSKVKAAGRANNRALGLANVVYQRGIRSLIGSGAPNPSQISVYRRSMNRFLALKQSGFNSLTVANGLQSQYAGIRSDLHRVLKDGHRISRDDLARSQRRLAREQARLAKAERAAYKQQRVVQKRARVTRDIMDSNSGSHPAHRQLRKRARALLLGSKERLIRRRRRVICAKMSVRRLQEQVVQRRSMAVKQNMEMLDQLSKEQQRATQRVLRVKQLVMRNRSSHAIKRLRKNAHRSDKLKSTMQKWKKRVVRGIALLKQEEETRSKGIQLRKLEIEKHLLSQEEKLAKMMRDREAGMHVDAKQLGIVQKNVKVLRDEM